MLHFWRREQCAGECSSSSSLVLDVAATANEAMALEKTVAIIVNDVVVYVTYRRKGEQG